jgi:hypothetical protein
VKLEDRQIYIDGVRVGTTEARSVPAGKEIRIELEFRPYWPGMFHLMAILADDHPKK